MLYVCDKIDLFEDDFPDNVMPLLSEQRREKVRQLGSVQSKKASAAAYLLLRTALKEVYGINKACLFTYTVKGKPMLKDHPLIWFSISHSHNIAACVVSDHEVGVDVQKITKVSDKVARRVLTDDEYDVFKSTSEPDIYFCEVWTVKESFLKKTGQGIAAELRDISADAVKDKSVFKGDGYFCCVCGSSVKSLQTADIRYIGGEDFGKLFK